MFVNLRPWYWCRRRDGRREVDALDILGLTARALRPEPIALTVSVSDPSVDLWKTTKQTTVACCQEILRLNVDRSALPETSCSCMRRKRLESYGASGVAGFLLLLLLHDHAGIRRPGLAWARWDLRPGPYAQSRRRSSGARPGSSPPWSPGGETFFQGGQGGCRRGR